MRIKNKKIKKLTAHYKEMSLLSKTNAVLGWDLNVNLPPKGGPARAEQMANITGLITDKWQDKDFKKNLEEAGKVSLNEEEKAVVRNLNYLGKYFFKVPKEIIVKFSRETSEAFIAWQEARKKDDFSLFEPHLKGLVELNKIIAHHLGFKENLYDALLDLYEPGLTAKECQKMFTTLQPFLTKTLERIKKTKSFKENLFFDGYYPKGLQKRVALFVLRKMGYDLEAGRMDVSTHPFTNELSRFDIRITNRYKENDFVESIMVAMHEGGHALYEQGINEDLDMTPLEGGVSLGIHESQSRFWENQIGRSREFISFLTPVLQSFYPTLTKFSGDEMYRLFNRVSPGLIRVEADEVTYNLHVALRFELEKKLLDDKIKVKDLPEVWREKMKKYLGSVPENDKEGVLQDVHWSHGSFGYFPTYTLGNLYSAQFTQKMAKEIDLKEISQKAKLGTILSWLRSNIHRYGSLYFPNELVKKVTGEKLNPKYFIKYLEDKYSSLYQ